jgi:hypothetical protein
MRLSRLLRTNLDGSSPVEVWAGRAQTWVVDPAAGRGFVECDTVSVCGFDFATPQTTSVSVPSARVASFALDPFNRRVYWSERANVDTSIYYLDYAAGNPVEVISQPGASWLAFLVDAPRDRFYWASGLGVVVSRLDGSEQTVLVPSSNAYNDSMALDLAGGKLCYREKNNDRVQRTNLDGTGVETVLDVEYPEGISLYLCVR